MTLHIMKVNYYDSWENRYATATLYATSKKAMKQTIEQWFEKMEKIQGDYFHRENCDFRPSTTEII